MLECGHVFCEHCMDGWRKVSDTCPLCRMALRLGGEVHSVRVIYVNEAPEPNDIARRAIVVSCAVLLAVTLVVVVVAFK